MGDLNKMPPAELRAAIQGGTAGWGCIGSSTVCKTTFAQGINPWTGVAMK